MFNFSEYTKCSACTLQCKPVNGEDIDDVDIMIIGDAPNAQDHYRNKLFISPSGLLLRNTIREVIKHLGIESPKIHYTNAVLCRPNDDRAPNTGEIIACNDRLIEEIRFYKPKKILLCGATAVTAIYGVKTKLKDIQSIWQIYEGIPLLATYNPSAIMRTPTLFETFSNDILKVFDEEERTKYDWVAPRNYVWCETVQDVQDCLYHLIWCDLVSFDLETLLLDAYRGKVIILAFYDGYKTYIISHEIFEQVVEAFPQTNYVVHNAGMEFIWMYIRYGISILNMDDTLLMYHMIDPRKNVLKNLKTLAKKYLNIHDWDKPVENYINGRMDRCPKDVISTYVTYDVETCFELFSIFKQELIDNGCWDAYVNIVKPAIPVVHKMTSHGVRIDADYLAGVEEEYTKEANRLHSELIELSQVKHNPNSNLQIQKIIYDKFKCPNRNNSTGIEELHFIQEQMKDNTPEYIYKLVEYRDAKKFLSTYITGLLDKCHPDGRLRSPYKLEGTETGRLSGSLMTIPSRKGDIIKCAFLPDQDFPYFGSFDYKGLELKVGAHLSQDKNLIRRVNSEDMHKEMAALIFNIPLEEVTKDQRFVAKTGVFAVMYFATIGGLVFNLKKDFPAINFELAEKMITFMRNEFPDLYEYSLKLQKLVVGEYEGGKCIVPGKHYTETLFGRKRYFPLITPATYKDVMKQATNTPIQGTATDICLLAGIRISKEIGWDKFRQQLIIHDSIGGSLLSLEVGEQVKAIMEDVPFDTDVNFEVESSIGDKWR